MKNGSIVAFGDFLLPFFGSVSTVLYTWKHHLTTMENSPVPIVSLDHLTPLRAQIAPKLTVSHPASLLTSAAVFLNLAAPLRSLQTTMEIKLAEEQAILQKD